MENNQRVIDIVRLKGPLIPVQIAKEINTSILFASAMLSEQVSKGAIKISTIKIGGSPLYYIKGQEEKLQNFVDNLHEKEKKAFDMLKEKRILRDSEQEPLTRVTLRQIKDFAVPLDVKRGENSEIFWKWYLLPDEEAENLIKIKLKIKIPKKEKPKKEEETIQKQLKKEIIPEQLKKETIAEQLKKETAQERIKKETIQEKLRKEPEQLRKEAIQEKLKKETPLEQLQEQKQKAIKQEKPDMFLNTIVSYFNKHDIEIIEKNITKKEKEVEFIINLPSPVGTLEYFCKAKNKKRISDSDLASAIITGQAKKLPVLFLTNGELTKKAEEKINELKGIKIARM